MKIFQKTHFWKEHRTFIEVDAKEPEREGGYPKEGTLVLKIGEQSTIKNAFKLSIDEARALRDSLDCFIKKHDDNYSRLISEESESVESKVHISEDISVEPSLGFMDAAENKSEKEEPKRPKSEFYF